VGLLRLAALALLGEHPPAEQWLRATVAKFRAHLLPLGLAADGAQVEGPTFWASTMQYRLAFLDALRRVTGEDLFAAHAAAMDARLALASIAAPKSAGHDEDHQTVILQPSYGQLGYYSPVLLGLARFYRRPLYQYLAAWDHTAGSVQRTRYVTANGEWLLFAWGGNACAWFDPTVPAEAEAGAPLAFAFPSVGEAYLRSSYAPGDVVLGLRHGTAVIHAGGRAVLVDLSDGRTGAEGGDLSVKDDGRTGIVRDHGPAGCSGQVVRLQRPGRLVLARRTDTEQAFWCHGQPIRAGSRLRWPDGTELAVTRGSLATIAPAGYHDEKVVGLGLLRLQDPAPMVYPLVRVRPDQGRLEVQVAAAGHATEART